MSIGPYSLQAALRDFEEARFQAALRDVLARVTRRSEELLSYEEVAQRLHLSARSERGIQTIPVAAIIGSVGRSADFTRTFLPRRAADRERWVRVRNAFLDPRKGNLPPIEVYQVGEAYFVLDGNHRVSVARLEGVTYIEAHVIEIQTAVPFTADVTPEDLICKAEYAEFLEATGLGGPTSEFALDVRGCGQYPKLMKQIAVHQFNASPSQGREIMFHEAAADWLATVYAPLTLAIREHDMLRWFPDHTETDLYLWVVEHQQALEEELGWAIRPDAAITDLAVRSSPRARSSETAPGSWRKERLANRYLGHLFVDLLAPLNETSEAWNALEQAIVIAQKEGAAIHGLHIVRAGANKASAAVQNLRGRFQARCAEANVAGNFVIDTGAVARKISERALLTDLIVLNVAHPPAGGLSALSSGWRSILNDAARPVLAVPGAPTLFERALVIFDGSPKSLEALFVAAYIAESWKTALTVLTLLDGTEESAAALDRAHAYLDLHELHAAYISAEGSSPFILKLLEERNLDVLLTGRDSASRWKQVRGGSAVGHLMRESPRPVFVC
jgi:nucleotide-binding universal stress UspA family protein